MPQRRSLRRPDRRRQRDDRTEAGRRRHQPRNPPPSGDGVRDCERADRIGRPSCPRHRPWRLGGIEARRVREEAGLPAEGLSLGAYLGVAPHPDAEAALQLVKPVTAVYARFSSMAGHPVDDLDPEDASVIKALGEHYDTTRHGRGDAAHIAYLNDEFVDRFGVAGTPEHCVEKLAALVD